MEKINKKEGQQTWEEFCEEMKVKNIMPWEWQQHLPQHFQDFSDGCMTKAQCIASQRKA
ncbi:MAG: hypothetical protein IPL12_14870 [Bacteroidetes bacterium]|nr:hypothetical protein [Bacteroidota bacterium]